MGGGCRVNIRTPARSPINNVKDPLLVIPALLQLSLSLSQNFLFYFLRGNFPQTAAPDFLTRKFLPNDMKKTGILAAASVAAASASAISSSPSSPTRVPKSKAHGSRSEEANSSRSNNNSGASSDKFAPKFDGLRFIETLVTAHR